MSLMTKTVLTVGGREVKVLRKNGKKVDHRDLPKLLGKETPVLVFSRGKIDPFYLHVIQDQVLIVVIPASKNFPWK